MDPTPNVILERIIGRILDEFISSPEFNKLVDEACLKIAEKSTPSLRAEVREFFMTKVGL